MQRSKLINKSEQKMEHATHFSARDAA